MKLPGINTKNIRRVLNKVEDLGQLISLSLVILAVPLLKNKRIFQSFSFCLNRRSCMNCWKTVLMQKNFGMLYILPSIWQFWRRNQRAKTKAKRVKVGGADKENID